MAHEIFISHSSKDVAAAGIVCAALEARGIRCWIAPRDVLPGVSYGEAIIDAINQCRFFVLIFSAHSNKSQQVLREVERAASKNIAIVPFRL
ncbi:MAG TPA: toll/interleukin-1 receptor domain-containing protein, partial [Pyrinomonadaceae bacterium]